MFVAVCAALRHQVFRFYLVFELVNLTPELLYKSPAWIHTIDTGQLETIGNKIPIANANAKANLLYCICDSLNATDTFFSEFTEALKGKFHWGSCTLITIIEANVKIEEITHPITLVSVVNMILSNITICHYKALFA